MSELWIEYRAAYRDCSEWLAQVFLPWRWVVLFHEITADLRSSSSTRPPHPGGPGARHQDPTTLLMIHDPWTHP